MRTDLRVKHDVETRRRASELFERGYGRISTAKALRVPRQTVEKCSRYTARSEERRCCPWAGSRQATRTSRRWPRLRPWLTAERRRPRRWPSSASCRLRRWRGGAGSTARAALRRSSPSRRAGPRARGRSRASAPASRSSRSAAAGSRRRSPT